MKLSEAIRLGSMLKPQTHGAYFDDDGTCALGAALDAVGQLKKSEDYRSDRVKRIWPWLSWPVENNPKGKNMADLVICFNDKHRASRERIADWVAGIERAIEERLAGSKDKLAQLEAHLKAAVKKNKTKEVCEPVGV